MSLGFSAWRGRVNYRYIGGCLRGSMHDSRHVRPGVRAAIMNCFPIIYERSRVEIEKRLLNWPAPMP